MAASTLVEIDSLEVTVIVDNELDPISPLPNPAVVTPLPMYGIPLTLLEEGQHCSESKLELRMDSICCVVYGLSLMIVRRCTGPLLEYWPHRLTLNADRY